MQERKGDTKEKVMVSRVNTGSWLVGWLVGRK